MPVPDYQSLMLPLLQFVEDGKDHTLAQAAEIIANKWGLSEEERKQIRRIKNELILARDHNHYVLIRAKIDELNHATLHLAETMMNSAVSGALKGTKV